MKSLKIMTLIVMVATLVLLTGCSKRSDAQIIKDTYNKMTSLHNFDVNIIQDVNADNVDRHQTKTIHLDMQSESEGLIKFNADLNATQHVEGYIERNNDDIMGYENQNNEWTKTMIPEDNYNLFLSYQYLLNALHNNSKIEKTGTDTLDDGTKVSVYNITFTDHDIMKEIVNSTDTVDKLGITQKQLNDATKDMVIKVYIDTNKNLVRKMEFDLKTTVNQILNLMDGSHASKVYYTFTFDNFGKVTVNIPEEVKDQTTITSY